MILGANLETNKHPDDIQALVNAGAKLVRWQVHTSPQFTLDMAIDELIAETKIPLKVVVLFLPADQLLSAWIKVATRLKGLPGIYGYDLINEPHMPRSRLKKLIQKLVTAIRAIDPSARIIASPKFGTARELSRMKPIKGVDIYTAHLYAPHRYTHQGVEPRFPYPREMTTKDREEMSKDVARVVKWQKKYHKPIFIGEFSAARWAPRCGEWLEFVIGYFKVNNWNACYHSFRNYHAWDVEKSASLTDGNEPRLVTDRFEILKSYWNEG